MIDRKLSISCQQCDTSLANKETHSKSAITHPVEIRNDPCREEILDWWKSSAAG